MKTFAGPLRLENRLELSGGSIQYHGWQKTVSNILFSRNLDIMTISMLA